MTKKETYAMSILTPEQLRRLRQDLDRQPPIVGNHLETEELLDYAFERLQPEEVSRAMRHVDGCEVCAEDLETVLDVVTSCLASPSLISIGTRPDHAGADRLQALSEHLGSEDALRRTAALEVAGALGESAVHPDLLRSLCAVLIDPDRNSEVRVTAAETLGKIGSKACYPEVLSALEKCLREGPEEVQEAAAYAVGNIGSATLEIQTALGTLCKHPEEIAGTAASWAVSRLGSAIEKRSVIDQILLLLVHSDLQIRRWAGEFLKKAPKAAERFRDTATAWLQNGAVEIARLRANPAAGSAGPASGSVLGWPQSGSLAGGRISFELDLAQRGEKDEVDLRFGSHSLDLENVVLTIDAVSAPGPGEATTSAVSAYLWFVVLGKRGSDQVGARIRIPCDDLPTGSPYGVEFRVRMVN